MPPLHGALALKERIDVPMLVAEDLNLNVLPLIDVLLKQQPRISKVPLTLRRSPLQLSLQPIQTNSLSTLSHLDRNWTYADSSLTILIPFPPPPALALMSKGYPILLPSFSKTSVL